MSQENVEVVRRSIDAYNRRDFEELRELNHADVEVDWSASRGLEARVHRGWEEAMAFYRGFLEMFEVKQGPYAGDEDKTRFDGRPPTSAP